MRNTISLLMISLFLWSCAPNKEELVIPGRIIPIDKMTSILVDVQLAEGALIYKRSSGQVYSDFKEYYYTFVFNKYEITRTQFDKSMDFYKENLDILDNIYEEVVRRLEEMKRIADSSRENGGET